MWEEWSRVMTARGAGSGWVGVSAWAAVGAWTSRGQSGHSQVGHLLKLLRSEHGDERGAPRALNPRLASLHGDGCRLRMLERFPGGVLHESFDGVGAGRRGGRPGEGLVQGLPRREVLPRP